MRCDPGWDGGYRLGSMAIAIRTAMIRDGQVHAQALADVLGAKPDR